MKRVARVNLGRDLFGALADGFRLLGF